MVTPALLCSTLLRRSHWTCANAVVYHNLVCILRRNFSGCCSTAWSFIPVSLSSLHFPNRATIHQASPPHRQQIPTNRQVRQGKNSQLEHVATQRIQGQKQQSVKDVTPLHQVPSDDGPAIEGTGPSCDPISNSDHNNHGTVPSTSDHDARATNFPFLSHCCSFPYLFSPPFSLPFFPLPFPLPFPFPFSLLFPLPCPFSCHNPCQPTADTVTSESLAAVLTAATSIGCF